jgi:pimeloyl-ACP methyl ester carboxylesterase
MQTQTHTTTNPLGYRLVLKQSFDPNTLQPGRRPLLIIPGYGMNSFIFRFHPSGPSLVESLVTAGFEVWTLDLPGQGDADPLPKGARHAFEPIALLDLPAAFEALLNNSRTGADRLDPIGCSLGTALLCAYLAHHPKEHRFGALVSMGGPLRWEESPVLLRLLFASPRLAGSVSVRGARQFARAVLPIARRVPLLLRPYMNARGVDLSRAGDLVQTVEDPHPPMNEEFARWFHARDLEVRGLNVTRALSDISLPALCIYANKDGIVPPRTALSLLDALGGDDKFVIRAGDESDWFAHADLFINRRSQEWVFQPLIAWLSARNSR